MFKRQMTSTEFNVVDDGRIVHVPGKCPGFATFPAFRGRGAVDRDATLAKAIRERDVW
jgi:hypothetical protein